MWVTAPSQGPTTLVLLDSLVRDWSLGLTSPDLLDTACSWVTPEQGQVPVVPKACEAHLEAQIPEAIIALKNSEVPVVPKTCEARLKHRYLWGRLLSSKHAKHAWKHRSQWPLPCLRKEGGTCSPQVMQKHSLKHRYPMCHL